MRDLWHVLNGLASGDTGRAVKTPTSRPLVLGEAHQAIVASLARTVGHPALSAHLFLACADGLKRAVRAGRLESINLIADRLRESLARAGRAPGPADPRVVKALAMLQASVKRGTRCLEVAVACELNVDRAHLGRLVLCDTRLGFREWRRIFALRAAASKLSNREVPVSEIAAQVGYRHLSQFDREFRDVFGINPRAFRRLLPPG